jgi:hypothetical protein
MRQSKNKLMRTQLFFVLSFLALITFSVTAQQTEQQKLDWKDYIKEFSPGVSDPGFLVVDKNTFKDFILVIQSKEANYESQIDSLNSLLEATSDTATESTVFQKTDNDINGILKTVTEEATESGNLKGILNILLSLLFLVFLYLWYKNNQELKIQEESLQNVEEDFLRYKRSTLEREKKMTKEIIKLKRVINPEE